MFAAAPYVEKRLLRSNGYNKRRAIRRAFYLRVWLLCDSDYKSDRLTVLATVLLMTCWHEEP
ncbi:uncharacterized protein TrAFT101_000069 [Trichoderma asperellum]|uniref:uncharacterized protein n=1 Tax=Trichoderma asperellum TaxID=101201 RepID=UPI0033263B93|nr:hypothetical protein TrAFT101_000069 [Trichoderma asperellum]